MMERSWDWTRWLGFALIFFGLNLLAAMCFPYFRMVYLDVKEFMPDYAIGFGKFLLVRWWPWLLLSGSMIAVGSYMVARRPKGPASV